MALVIELEVDDKGTPKIVKFEKTVKGLGDELGGIKPKADKGSTAFQKLGGFVRKTAGGFRVFTQVAKTGLKILGGIAIGVAGVVFALDKLFKSVVEVSAVKLGFQQMAAAVGGATEVLLKAQQATKGLVSDLDLMRQFNNAVALGVADSAQQFANLTGAALTLGRALGVGPQRAIDSLVIGIGRQSRLMLDNLGIIVSVEEANKKFAASLGKMVSELTLAERQTAFKLEADVKLKVAMESLGGIVLSAADQWQVLKISLTNTANEFKVGIGDSKVLAISLDRLSVVAGRLTGDFDGTSGALDLTGKVVKFVVNSLAFLLKALGFILIFIDPVVLGFNILVRTIINLVRIALSPLLIAFAGIITGLNAIGQVSDETVVAVNDFVEGIVTLNDFLPESTDQLKGFAENVLILGDSFDQLGVELSTITNLTSTLSDEQKKQAEVMKLILKFTKSLLSDTESLVKVFNEGGVPAVRNFIKEQVKLAKITLTSQQFTDLFTRSMEIVAEQITKTKDALKELAKEEKKRLARLKQLKETVSGLIAIRASIEKGGLLAGIVGEGAAGPFFELAASITELNKALDELGEPLVTAEEKLALFFDGLFTKFPQASELIGQLSKDFAETFVDVVETTGNIGAAFAEAAKAAAAGLLRTIATWAAQNALLFALVGAVSLVPPPNPFFNPAVAAQSFALSALLFGVAAGAGLAAGALSGKGKSSTGANTETQQRRRRDTQRQQGGDALGQANVILIGDFFGTPEFAQKIATDISKQVGKNRLNLEASDSILAAQIND